MKFFLKYTVLIIFVLEALSAAQCPKYEDMIIIQHSKTIKAAKFWFFKTKEQVQDVQIITQSNPYFKKITAFLKNRRFDGVKASPNKEWSYVDGITFCFANHPEKTVKIQHIDPNAEDFYVYRHNGYTFRINMKKSETQELYRLINLALGKKSSSLR